MSLQLRVDRLVERTTHVSNRTLSSILGHHPHCTGYYTTKRIHAVKPPPKMFYLYHQFLVSPQFLERLSIIR